MIVQASADQYHMGMAALLAVLKLASSSLTNYATQIRNGKNPKNSGFGSISPET